VSADVYSAHCKPRAQQLSVPHARQTRAIMIDTDHHTPAHTFLMRCLLDFHSTFFAVSALAQVQAYGPASHSLSTNGEVRARVAQDYRAHPLTAPRSTRHPPIPAPRPSLRLPCASSPPSQVCGSTGTSARRRSSTTSRGTRCGSAAAGSCEWHAGEVSGVLSEGGRAWVWLCKGERMALAASESHGIALTLR
jgi:hypothetical protein